MGNSWSAGLRRHAERFSRARHCVSHADAENGWILGREILYGDWIPARVLSHVSPVPGVLPAACADYVREGDGEEQQLVEPLFLLEWEVRSVAGGMRPRFLLIEPFRHADD